MPNAHYTNSYYDRWKTHWPHQHTTMQRPIQACPRVYFRALQFRTRSSPGWANMIAATRVCMSEGSQPMVRLKTCLYQASEQGHPRHHILISSLPGLLNASYNLASEKGLSHQPHGRAVTAHGKHSCTKPAVALHQTFIHKTCQGHQGFIHT